MLEVVMSTRELGHWGERLARAILQAREGDIQVEPGYDGVFGKVSLKSTEPESCGEARMGVDRR